MSSNYQQPQQPYQPPPQQPQQPQQPPYYAAPQHGGPQHGGPQHPGAYHPPGGMAPGAALPPPGGGRKRGPLIAVVLVVVLALGVAGVMFLGGGDDGDGGGGGSDVAMTAHPDLKPMDFPDARALGYDEGADAACEAVSEIMVARGYEFQSAENNDGGIDCWYATPAASSFQDGTNYFRANVYMSMGSVAEDAYASFTSAIASYEEGERGESMWGPLYEFPVGEEGWIRYNTEGTGRGDGTSSFRKADTTFYVTAFGWVEGGDTDEALTEETTFREVTDIVTALGGGDAGEPQISESAAEEYPGELPEFGDTLLPTEGSAEERCAPLTTVATEQLDSQAETINVGGTGTVPITSCVYGPAEAAYGMENVGIRNTRIEMNDYSGTDTFYPAGELGSSLRHTMDLAATEEGYGQLYALPAGTSGYMIYRDDGYGNGHLEAGWVVGDYYVNVTLGGFFNAGDFDTRALTEEEMVADLSALLTALDG